VLSDEREEYALLGLEETKRESLIALRECGIADHVSKHYRSKTALALGQGHFSPETLVDKTVCSLLLFYPLSM
jgi:hypothetical protein